MSAGENTAPGCILYLRVSFPQWDEFEYHDRYFVLVDRAKYPILLKLNTSDEISEIAKRKKESIFLFKKSVYPGLDHDRFIDCGTPWIRLLSLDEIVQQVSKEPKKRFIGEVTSDHKREIVLRTGKSDSFNRIQKQIVRDCLV